MPVTAATITIEMLPAISAYSMAVAPDGSSIKRGNFDIGCSDNGVRKSSANYSFISEKLKLSVKPISQDFGIMPKPD
jgi:hypothetical protein